MSIWNWGILIFTIVWMGVILLARENQCKHLREHGFDEGGFDECDTKEGGEVSSPPSSVK